MIRKTKTPRVNWQQKVESKGMVYHTSPEGKVYWDESAYYVFTMEQIEHLENVTNELHEMCLLAAERIIEKKMYDKLKIPESAIPLIESTWENEPPSLYGRFDFSWDGVGEPKMLEYNADTPTSLLEASVIQWFWLREEFRFKDQFNSIDDKLVAKWKELVPFLARDFAGSLSKHPPTVHFAHMDDWEDGLTVTYLRDCAHRAGIKTIGSLIENIHWNGEQFVDAEDTRILSLFKLYPWEWMVNEEYGLYLSKSNTQFIEPAWKMLLSNKGILPILWEMFPDHPNLLAASFEKNIGKFYVKKPLLSREGSNVEIVSDRGETIFRSQGDYGEEGYVYQAFAPLPDFDGKFPVIGSWVIDQEAVGMGIRESDDWITSNTSRFVPHLIDSWRLL